MELFKKSIEESDSVQLKAIRIKLHKHINSQKEHSGSWIRRLNFLMGRHDILSMREMHSIEVSRGGDTKD